MRRNKQTGKMDLCNAVLSKVCVHLVYYGGETRDERKKSIW